ncbi:MAG: hypothetical protein AAFR51_05680 [Pseudomonadota bacterium]
MRLVQVFVTFAAVSALNACGVAGDDSAGAKGTAQAGEINCPPAQKGNGIAVSSRFDYDDLLDSNRWRDEMYSKSCAGSLAAYVPDLPEGFGVVPTVQPYIMNEDQVYLSYGEIPEPLIDEESGQPNVPADLDRIDIEVRRFSADELTEARTWLAANPKDYVTAEIDGETVYLVNGLGFGRMGKGDRLLTALQVFQDNGVVLRVSHRSLFNSAGGLSISPLVDGVMSDMLTAE